MKMTYLYHGQRYTTREELIALVAERLRANGRIR
jgi:hypothetical protein